jgi:regulator of protease activity HflC (stomatin/prohibitin superfamily)
LWLIPGRHRLVVSPLRKLQILRVRGESLAGKLLPDHLALAPVEDLRVVRLAPHERGIVRMNGVPVRWLSAGEHQVLTLERAAARPGVAARPVVEVEIVDTSAIEAPVPLRDVQAIVPATDLVEVEVPHGAVALRLVDGRLDATLGPGRHAAWTTLRKVAYAVIDLRERVVQVSGQEVMTRDRVTLRLNLAVTVRVADPVRLVSVARDADEVIHLAVQLAAREAVATRSLDELLAARDPLSGAIAEEVARRGEAVGLAVHSLALKDVILPGEMKTLLNRVIEAQKEAEANVILRREETAATRSLAQTAKVLAENPLIMRLKELEALGSIASKVGTLHVVLGKDALPSLKLEA